MRECRDSDRKIDKREREGGGGEREGETD